MSFFDKLREGISIISGYISIAISILTTFNDIMPTVVEFIIAAVDKFFGKIEKGEATPAEARETVVSETLAEFHGSGPVITEQDVRTVVEQYVKIAKAKRGEFDYKKENIAVDKGFVKETEIEKIRKAWPNFTPLD